MFQAYMLTIRMRSFYCFSLHMEMPSIKFSEGRRTQSSTAVADLCPQSHGCLPVRLMCSGGLEPPVGCCLHMSAQIIAADEDCSILLNCCLASQSLCNTAKCEAW